MMIKRTDITEESDNDSIGSVSSRDVGTPSLASHPSQSPSNLNDIFLEHNEIFPNILKSIKPDTNNTDCIKQCEVTPNSVKCITFCAPKSVIQQHNPLMLINANETYHKPMIMELKISYSNALKHPLNTKFEYILTFEALNLSNEYLECLNDIKINKITFDTCNYVSSNCNVHPKYCKCVEIISASYCKPIHSSLITALKPVELTIECSTGNQIVTPACTFDSVRCLQISTNAHNLCHSYPNLKRLSIYSRCFEFDLPKEQLDYLKFVGCKFNNMRPEMKIRHLCVSLDMLPNFQKNQIDTLELLYSPNIPQLNTLSVSNLVLHGNVSDKILTHIKKPIKSIEFVETRQKFNLPSNVSNAVIIDTLSNVVLNGNYESLTIRIHPDFRSLALVSTQLIGKVNIIKIKTTDLPQSELKKLQNYNIFFIKS